MNRFWFCGRMGCDNNAQESCPAGDCSDCCICDTKAEGKEFKQSRALALARTGVVVAGVTEAVEKEPELGEVSSALSTDWPRELMWSNASKTLEENGWS